MRSGILLASALLLCIYTICGSDVDDAPTKSGIKLWVDVETPENAQTITTTRGHIYDLVMSDEFNGKRNFTAGQDHLWTALDIPDGVNKAVGYYNPSNAYTEDGLFKIRIDEGDVPIRYWDQYSGKPKWTNAMMVCLLD